MLDNLNKINADEPEDRTGLTRLELMAIVGALTVFASILYFCGSKSGNNKPFGHRLKSARLSGAKPA